MPMYSVRGHKKAGSVIQTASNATNAIALINEFERDDFITSVFNADGRECLLPELQAQAAGENRYFGRGPHIARLL